MRHVLVYLAACGLVLACAATAAAEGSVTGVYKADGKAATLTEVTAHNDDPFDGKPVIALVFTEKPQGAEGDADDAEEADQGDYGDAIVVRVEADGSVIGADMCHRGLVRAHGYVTEIGVLSLTDFRVADGQISGHLTSGGPSDLYDGEKIDVDLTFRAKAPAAAS